MQYFLTIKLIDITIFYWVTLNTYLQTLSVHLKYDIKSLNKWSWNGQKLTHFGLCSRATLNIEIKII